MDILKWMKAICGIALAVVGGLSSTGVIMPDWIIQSVALITGLGLAATSNDHNTSK